MCGLSRSIRRTREKSSEIKVAVLGSIGILIGPFGPYLYNKIENINITLIVHYLDHGIKEQIYKLIEAKGSNEILIGPNGPLVAAVV